MNRAQSNLKTIEDCHHHSLIIKCIDTLVYTVVNDFLFKF